MAGRQAPLAVPGRSVVSRKEYLEKRRQSGLKKVTVEVPDTFSVKIRELAQKLRDGEEFQDAILETAQIDTSDWNNLRTERDQALAKVEELSARFDEARDVLARAKGALEQAQQDADEERRRADDAHKKLGAREEQSRVLQDLQQRLESAHWQLGRAEGQDKVVQVLRSQLAEARNKIDDLENENDDLFSELETLRGQQGRGGAPASSIAAPQGSGASSGHSSARSWFSRRGLVTRFRPGQALILMIAACLIGMVTTPMIYLLF